MRDAAVQKATGKNWEQWFSILDSAGAKTMAHRDIAILLAKQYKVKPWWTQMVTVEYEYARGKRKKPQPLRSVPQSIMRHIRANKTAIAGFNAMPPSHKREYIEYIQGAKKSETRSRRIKKSVEMMAQWWKEKKKKKQRT